MKTYKVSMVLFISIWCAASEQKIDYLKGKKLTVVIPERPRTPTSELIPSDLIQQKSDLLATLEELAQRKNGASLVIQFLRKFYGK